LSDGGPANPHSNCVTRDPTDSRTNFIPTVFLPNEDKFKDEKSSVTSNQPLVTADQISDLGTITVGRGASGDAYRTYDDIGTS